MRMSILIRLLKALAKALPSSRMQCMSEFSAKRFSHMAYLDERKETVPKVIQEVLYVYIKRHP